MKNAVQVRFLYRNKKLSSKSYVFKAFPKVAEKIKKNQIIFVKSNKGTPAAVVVEEVLSLPPRKAREHKPILEIRNLHFFKPKN